MEQITYSHPTIDQALTLSVLLKTVYIATYAVDGVTYDFANFIEMKFSEYEIRNKIEKNPENIIVAFHKNNPVGIAIISFERNCPVRKRPLPELSKLYILDRFGGQGIGEALLKKVENSIILKGYNELWLEVYLKNTKAISFYEKYGYRQIGTVDFFINSKAYKDAIFRKILSV